MTPQEMNSLYGKPPAPPVNSQPKSFESRWASQAPEQPKQDFLSKASDAVSSIFPGQKIGQAIGTSLVATSQDIQGHHDIAKNLMSTSPTVGQQLGDAANSMLSSGGMLLGGGEAKGGLAVAKRIGTNALVGSGMGAANSVAEGDTGTDIAKNAGTGLAVGGALSAAGEGVNKLTQELPNWFTKMALPKLGGAVKGTPQETIDYALKNTKGATLKTMVGNSKNAINSYEGQIQSVLNHPQYANETGKVIDGLKEVQSALPNAGLDDNKVVSILKQVAPQNKTLVDKVAKGTANLMEQNMLRKELDIATKAAYGDKPTLSFAKQVGKGMADFLRTNVQGTAKETAPIFAEYSKEHTLNKALTSALSKKRVAGPLVAGSAGFAAKGIPGALEAIAIEEGLRSPTAKLLAGKAIRGASKVTMPAIKAGVQAGKAPIIKSLSNRK